MEKINKYISNDYQRFFDTSLSETDPDLYNSIKLEFERQQQHIELIASENIVSKAVLDAQGSIMTNKYAEGYPSKRYYGGCEFVDIAEELALERVKKLFNCKYANVQPHQHVHIHYNIFFQDNLLHICLLKLNLVPLIQPEKLYFQKQSIQYVVAVFLTHH